MHEALMYNITNPTFVINSQHQAVEIPKHFNQILHYDKEGKCAEFSKNIRYLVGGLNAGVITNANIFYKSVPEIITFPKLNINRLDRNKKCEIYIKDLPKTAYQYTVLSNIAQKQGECNIVDTNDSYVVK